MIINKENIKKISNKILSLEFSEQLTVINDIINNYYTLYNNSENKMIGDFLIQKSFSIHRRILTDIFFDDKLDKLSYNELIKSHEKNHNIIIDTSEI